MKTRVEEARYWVAVRSDLKNGEVVYMRCERWNIANFMEQLNTTIKHVGDGIETIELDIENIKGREGEMFGDFTLSIIPKPKLKLDLTPFDLFTWIPLETQHDKSHDKSNETVVYMRLLMMENCHIEKGEDELLPIVYVDKEAYTESEYHIITNYLEYLGIETEDLEK